MTAASRPEAQHPVDDHDAIIVGGGLAGLSLALQLKRKFHDMRILVLERMSHPLPVATHKVGESTVEIGAHYLANVLGLKAHLDEQHLRKFGLRFFFSHGCQQIDQAVELGLTRYLPLPSYQVDRGMLETFMADECRRRGIDFRDACLVRQCQLGGDTAPHTVTWTQNDRNLSANCRWLLDASGRRGLLKRQLDLSKDNNHHAHAVWFRIDQHIGFDAMGSDPAWRALCSPPGRWLSTNHLTGPGYWVWLIPLASGAHSIGIVADSQMHELDDMRDFDSAMRWLARNQPALARALEPLRDKLLDFRFLRNYSHSARQVFSADRWALTGEAGTFIDPFYSPGTDFIAMANSYITALIGQDRAGQPLAPWARMYQDLFFSFYDSTLELFEGQYPLFGNARVMTQKITWDYGYYWGIVCPLVFQDRLTDIHLLGELRDALRGAMELNHQMQSLFRDWLATLDPATDNNPGLIDQGQLPWLVEMNRQMGESLDRSALHQRLRHNIHLLHNLAASIGQRALSDAPDLSLPSNHTDMPLALLTTS